MGKGVLEVHLVDAKGLYGNDFLGACVHGPRLASRRRIALVPPVLFIRVVSFRSCVFLWVARGR